jgi:hypothetical protein
MTKVKRAHALLVLAFALRSEIFVLTVFAHADQAMAYTTVITHEDKAVGGCGGQGC